MGNQVVCTDDGCRRLLKREIIIQRFIAGFHRQRLRVPENVFLPVESPFRHNLQIAIQPVPDGNQTHIRSHAGDTAVPQIVEILHSICDAARIVRLDG